MNRFFRLLTAAVVSSVAALLPASAAVAQAEVPKAAKPIKALLVIGGCCHDYGVQKQILQQGIAARGPIEITVVHEGDGMETHKHSVYEKPDWWKGYDVVIHDECSAKVTDLAFIENVLAAHKAGVPAVVLHCGMHNYRSEGYPKATPWFEFTGLKTTGHGPQQPIAITFTDKESPVTQGLSDWTTMNEELYNNTAGGVEPTAKVLAKGKQSYKDKAGKDKTDETIVAWTNEYGEKKTKVFATTIGHNNSTVADARYLNLVTRGLLWSVGRLDEFKASDANVDVKAITPDPWKKPAKPAEEKKADAGAGRELLVNVK